MTPQSLYLAVEDALSEFVLRRVVRIHPGLRVAAVFSRGGYGYLRKGIGGFNEAARHWPFVVLTDLDKGLCAPDLVKDWLGDRPRHPHLLLRVAVPEVESWLLADGSRLRRFLGLRGTREVPYPEQLPDAKAELLLWAEKAPARDMKDALVWRDRAGQRHPGPDYNGTLARFVHDHWDLQASASRCPSLAGLLRAVAGLEQDRDRR